MLIHTKVTGDAASVRGELKTAARIMFNTMNDGIFRMKTVVVNPNPVPGQPPERSEKIVDSDPETIRQRIYDLTINNSNKYLQGIPDSQDVGFITL